MWTRRYRVQQTTDEHRAGGFDCVKVVVPGTLPMTFGHSLRRTDGIPRILDVPVTLGYRDRPLQPFEINRTLTHSMTRHREGHGDTFRRSARLGLQYWQQSLERSRRVERGGDHIA